MDSAPNIQTALANSLKMCYSYNFMATSTSGWLWQTVLLVKKIISCSEVKASVLRASN